LTNHQLELKKRLKKAKDELEKKKFPYFWTRSIPHPHHVVKSKEIIKILLELLTSLTKSVSEKDCKVKEIPLRVCAARSVVVRKYVEQTKNLKQVRSKIKSGEFKTREAIITAMRTLWRENLDVLLTRVDYDPNVENFLLDTTFNMDEDIRSIIRSIWYEHAEAKVQDAGSDTKKVTVQNRIVRDMCQCM